MARPDAGRLYVVATPLGNLGDLSPRAAEVLTTADVIAAEDTRVTRRLLGSSGAGGRLLSYREENERTMAPRLVRRLLAGESVALVSDAGTPVVSDPGYRVVRAAAEAGIEIVAVPGPSAVVALLSVSGLPSDRFSFEGFLPARGAARRRALEALAESRRTVVLYESPRRILTLLEELRDACADPPVAVGRELTKRHEQVLRGPASAVWERLARAAVRGEFTVAVDLSGREPAVLQGAALQREVARLLAEGLSVRDIAGELRARGVARRAVYDTAAKLEKKKPDG